MEMFPKLVVSSPLPPDFLHLKKWGKEGSGNLKIVMEQINTMGVLLKLILQFNYLYMCAASHAGAFNVIGLILIYLPAPRSPTVPPPPAPRLLAIKPRALARLF